MNEAKLKRLIRMVEDSDIDELEIDRPFGRVRITKRRAVEPPEVIAATESVPARADSLLAPPETSETAPAPAPREPGVVSIVAPMVGTFFVAPAPGAKPYVSEGDRVAVGQVVCIVEAMKLMNEVQSDVAGTIREIRVENGQAVEYGQELFTVAPG
jgi:acetyl-CoA carboxylase biotin carboxyl carrier protein